MLSKRALGDAGAIALADGAYHTALVANVSNLLGVLADAIDASPAHRHHCGRMGMPT